MEPSSSDTGLESVHRPELRLGDERDAAQLIDGVVVRLQMRVEHLLHDRRSFLWEFSGFALAVAAGGEHLEERPLLPLGDRAQRTGAHDERLHRDLPVLLELVETAEGQAGSDLWTELRRWDEQRTGEAVSLILMFRSVFSLRPWVPAVRLDSGESISYEGNQPLVPGPGTDPVTCPPTDNHEGGTRAYGT